MKESQLFSLAGLYFILSLLIGLFLFLKCGIGVAQFAFAGGLIAILYPFLSPYGASLLCFFFYQQVQVSQSLEYLATFFHPLKVFFAYYTHQCTHLAYSFRTLKKPFRIYRGVAHTRYI